MEYIYGNPDKTHLWENVVSIFAATHSLHSETTSSLPLVQFWRASGKTFEGKQLNPDAQELLEKCLGEKGTDKVDQLCFEYPVPVHRACGGRGKASMTDLMIITSFYAIALEAKYTEYLSGKQESISQWLKDPKGGTILDNRKNVLQGWLNYISEKGCSDIRKIEEVLEKLNDVQYQLFHRIASACAAAKEPTRKPVVIYQVFCDEQEEAKEKARIFAEQLKGDFDVLTKQLGLKNISFYVVITPVTNKPGPGTSKDDLGQLFLRMLEKNNGDIFKFGKTVKVTK